MRRSRPLVLAERAKLARCGGFFKYPELVGGVHDADRRVWPRLRGPRAETQSATDSLLEGYLLGDPISCKRAAKAIAYTFRSANLGCQVHDLGEYSRDLDHPALPLWQGQPVHL